MEEITAYDNISRSIDVVLRGKKRKKNRFAKKLLKDRDAFISSLSKELNEGIYSLGGYEIMEVIDGPKQRTVQVISYRDRIAVNSVMTIVDKYINPTFIRTTSASIKQRGTHDLLRYVCRDIQNNPNETTYCYKCDVKKFYDSIDQDIMYNCVQRHFKDFTFLKIADKFIRMLPKGLSIGLRSSQCFGNLLLSDYLDHILKDRLGVKFYYRYCDDIVVLSNSKEYLRDIKRIIEELLGDINLFIKPNDRIFPTMDGIDFLGYIIYPNRVKLRKRVKKKFAKSLKKASSNKRVSVLTASLYGMCCHADCTHLFEKLTGISMKNFKELEIKYRPVNGKKLFNCPRVSIRQLVNMEIAIVDCEFGVKTKMGDDRCIVAFHNGDTKGKFFTSSVEMIDILDQISKKQMFPFRTTLRAEVFDTNKTKYVFT